MTSILNLLDQVRSPILQNIPTLHKQRKNLSNPRQEDYTPQVRYSHAGIIDIDKVIDNSAEQIAASQGVEGLGWETSEVTGNNCGCKEAEVLEPVSLRAFAADNLVFGLRGLVLSLGRGRVCRRNRVAYGLVNCLVVLEKLLVSAWRAVVEDIGEGSGVGVWEECNNPGSWDLNIWSGELSQRKEEA